MTNDEWYGMKVIINDQVQFIGEEGWQPDPQYLAYCLISMLLHLEKDGLL